MLAAPLLGLLRPAAALGGARGLAAAPGSLAAIKLLREKSGAPISDVKAALEEAGYDADAAFTVLRKRGLAAATKKAARRSAEGLVGLRVEGTRGAIVEINSETDFVAGNDQFRSLVSTAAQAALRAESSAHAGPSGAELPVDAVAAVTLEGGKTLGAAVQDVAGTVRENIRLRRAFRLMAPEGGVLASYLHTSPAPGLGRIAALVALQGKGGASIPDSALPKAQELGHKLAMHAVAAKPLFLDRSAVPESVIEVEKGILREQAAKSGKPAEIIEKMILGRMNKYYEEVCFLNQGFIMDDSMQVRDVLKAAAKEGGAPLEIAAFARVQVGEGLEEESRKDFAAEVQETLAAV